MAKATAKKPVSRDNYEIALQEYVQNHNTYAKLAAKRDERVAKIDQDYDLQFNDLKESMEKQFETVQQFCEENRAELFDDAKSFDEFGATMGFREGKEKVIVLDGFDEKEIAKGMSGQAAWKKYIRLTPALDKAAIVKNKPKGLDKLGLKVGKEENFFLEVDQTEVNA
jgi:phage host-nuclease inhibitor protein Gam